MSASPTPRALSALALLALTACYTEANYEADFTEAMCAKTFECYDDAQQENLLWEDEDTCLDERVQQETSEDCEFDGGAAQACVEDTQIMSCQDFIGGRWPTNCEIVCGE